MYVHFSKVSAIKQEGVNFGPSECTYIIANIHKHTVYIHTCTVYRLCIYIYTIYILYIYTHYIYIYICHPCHPYIHTSIHPSIRTYVCTYIHYITLHCIALHYIALHCITLHTYIIYIYTHNIYIYIYIYIYTYPLNFPWFSKGFFHHADASSPWVLVFWCFFVKAMGSTPRYGHLNGEMIWNDDQQLDLLITDFVIPIKKTLNEWEWAMVF